MCIYLSGALDLSLKHNMLVARCTQPDYWQRVCLQLSRLDCFYLADSTHFAFRADSGAGYCWTLRKSRAQKGRDAPRRGTGKIAARNGIRQRPWISFWFHVSGLRRPSPWALSPPPLPPTLHPARRRTCLARNRVLKDRSTCVGP